MRRAARCRERDRPHRLFPAFHHAAASASSRVRLIRTLSMPLRSLLLFLSMAALSGCGDALLMGNTLVGCAGRGSLELRPDALPAGQVGRPYHADIGVAATASVHGFYAGDAHPLPPGLGIEHLHGARTAAIVGTPTRAGVYEVHLSAGTHGTQCVGQHAGRSYRVEIRE